MSTLNVANISDDQSTLTGSNENPIDSLHSNTTVDTKYVTNGCAKAWVLYDQSSSTATISNSMNLSTITDGAPGRATVNYTSSFSSNKYSPSGSCGPVVGVTNNIGVSLSTDAPNFTAGSTSLNTRNRSANADVDVPLVTLHSLGDLA